jgi:hypothetical protein
LITGQLLKKNNWRKLNMKMRGIIYINIRTNRAKENGRGLGKRKYSKVLRQHIYD